MDSNKIELAHDLVKALKRQDHAQIEEIRNKGITFETEFEFSIFDPIILLFQESDLTAIEYGYKHNYISKETLTARRMNIDFILRFSSRDVSDIVEFLDSLNPRDEED